MTDLDPQTRQYLNLATDSRTLPDLPNKKNKTNWVEKAGGLPSYIKRIAKHLHSEQDMTVSRAIAVAVNTVKRWCASGTITEGGKGNGGKGVSAKTKELACKAVAEWEAKRGASAVNASQAKPRMINFEGQLVFEDERDLILAIAAEMEATGDDEFDYSAFELALALEREERGLNDDGYAEEDEELGALESVHGEPVIDELPLSIETLDVDPDQQIDEDAYGQALEQARMSLATFNWDEELHPRNHGKFAKKLSAMKLGDKLELPSGVTVEKKVKIDPQAGTGHLTPVSYHVISVKDHKGKEQISRQVGVHKVRHASGNKKYTDLAPDEQARIHQATDPAVPLSTVAGIKTLHERAKKAKPGFKVRNQTFKNREEAIAAGAIGRGPGEKKPDPSSGPGLKKGDWAHAKHGGLVQITDPTPMTEPAHRKGQIKAKGSIGAIAVHPGDLTPAGDIKLKKAATKSSNELARVQVHHNGEHVGDLVRTEGSGRVMSGRIQTGSTKHRFWNHTTPDGPTPSSGSGHHTRHEALNRLLGR